MSFAVGIWVGCATLATRVWPLLVGATVRGGLLVLFAAAVVRIWPRSSAAQRHAVWAIVSCGLLLLPALQLVIPAWRVQMLPRAVTPVAVLTSAPVRLDGQPIVAASHETVASSDRMADRTGWLVLILMGWGSGTVGVLMVLLYNQRQMWRIMATTQPLTDSRMLGVLAQVSSILQLTRPVPVRMHLATMPMVCGVFRPVVVLPMSARTWGEARLRNVLLHELAHVQRYDCLTQTVASLAFALYWFNPLVWIAARALQVEREQACDDIVLAAGSQPRDYAMDLLELTQTAKPLRMASLAALAFARPAQLQTRVHAIIDRTRCRRLVSHWGTMAIWGTGLGIMYPLVGLTPQPRTEARLAQQKSTAPTAGVPPYVAAVLQHRDTVQDACPGSARVPFVVGVSTHQSCRAASASAGKYVPNIHHTHPEDNRHMKSSTRAAMLASAAAGLLAGAPVSSQAQTVPVLVVPGSPSRIQLRGMSGSVMLNPLVIVDGVQIRPDSSSEPTQSLIAKIDPSDIETIEVFKGPKAVELYGDKAKNGVIVITTKSSQASKK